MRALILTTLCALCGSAGADIATFDAMSEGDAGTTFLNGGITFYGFDDRAGGPATFSIDRADGTLSGVGFSSPNAMGFGSWVPGPSAAFAQCGEFWFTTGSVRTFASLDVFEWMSYGGNSITLQAYLGGGLVASDSVLLPGDLALNHWHLSVSAAGFDRLRLVGSGPTDRGVFFGLIDNVMVVPTPGVLGALGAGGLGALVRRRRGRPSE